MKDETYLNIFLSPTELSYDIKKLIMTKLTERYLLKEIDSRMITNMSLSKSLINSIELNIPVKIEYKTYKKGDIILGELFSNDKDEGVFVISYDIICEILNTNILDKIKSKIMLELVWKILKIQMVVFIFLHKVTLLFNYLKLSDLLSEL